jgi:hypothetical protein
VSQTEWPATLKAGSLTIVLLGDFSPMGEIVSYIQPTVRRNMYSEKNGPICEVLKEARLLPELLASFNNQ